MFFPDKHTEKSVPILLDFIRENPLGIFTTAIPSSTYPLIQSSHIPWVLDEIDDNDEGHDDNDDDKINNTNNENNSVKKKPICRLRGHMARMNPQVKAMAESLTPTFEQAGLNVQRNEGGLVLDQEVLVLFNSPIQHYVTPKFYTFTKPATGKVVPTWNYSAVEVYGKCTVYLDSKAPETHQYLTKQVDDLTRMCEETVMRYEQPWSVSDAPESYVEYMKKNIIGLSVDVTRIGGKFKYSRDKSAADRVGLIEGFDALGTDVGTGMAGMVKWRGELNGDKAK